MKRLFLAAVLLSTAISGYANAEVPSPLPLPLYTCRMFWEVVNDPDREQPEKKLGYDYMVAATGYAVGYVQALHDAKTQGKAAVISTVWVREIVNSSAAACKSHPELYFVDMLRTYGNMFPSH